MSDTLEYRNNSDVQELLSQLDDFKYEKLDKHSGYLRKRGENHYIQIATYLSTERFQKERKVQIELKINGKEICEMNLGFESRISIEEEYLRHKANILVKYFLY